MESIILVVALTTVLVFMVLVVQAAYRNGVRDGYQNYYLPHIRKQIRDEGLDESWTDLANWSDEEK